MFFTRVTIITSPNIRRFKMCIHYSCVHIRIHYTTYYLKIHIRVYYLENVFILASTALWRRHILVNAVPISLVAPIKIKLNRFFFCLAKIFGKKLNTMLEVQKICINFMHTVNIMILRQFKLSFALIKHYSLKLDK